MISDTSPPLFCFLSTAARILEVSGNPELGVVLLYYIPAPTLIAQFLVQGDQRNYLLPRRIPQYGFYAPALHTH